MRYSKVISFGLSCQPAKHIRAQLSQPEAYYFDWMISPLPALIRCIEDDFAGLLRPENLSYSDTRRIRIRDAANGLEYQHDFPVDATNPDPSKRDVILEGFQDHADSVRDKYLRRMERTQATLDSGDPILIVRYSLEAGELQPAARQSLVKALRTRHPLADLTFLWASMLASGFETVEDGFVCGLPKTTTWDGSPDGWRQILEFTGALTAQQVLSA